MLFADKLALKIRTMMTPLILYSTTHCHLCELAHTLLLTLADEYTLEIIDIAEDETLLERYGLSIPVLHRQDTKAELNWPFAVDNIRDFLI